METQENETKDLDRLRREALRLNINNKQLDIDLTRRDTRATITLIKAQYINSLWKIPSGILDGIKALGRWLAVVLSIGIPIVLLGLFAALLSNVRFSERIQDTLDGKTIRTPHNQFFKVVAVSSCKELRAFKLTHLDIFNGKICFSYIDNRGDSIGVWLGHIWFTNRYRITKSGYYESLIPGARDSLALELPSDSLAADSSIVLSDSIIAN